MTTWRGACVAAAMVVVLGGCANDDGPKAIDGQVDFVPADKSDRAANANAGTNDAVAAGSDTGSDTAPNANGPKVDKTKCAALVKASNALLDKRVVALFPKKALRQLEHLTPADTFNCDPKEGPDFGGVSALWKNITGAKAIKLFTTDGWTREDPADGAPDWATKGLKHGDGSLNYEPAEKYIVTFHLTRGGREFWAELTQDGMRAGLHNAG